MSHGTEKRLRTTHITIRLTVDERAAIDAAAEDAGLTPGSYIRQLALSASAPRPVRKRPAEHRDLARLLGELGKIGSNLNQIAKAANQGLAVYGNEILAALARLDEIRIAILKDLGRLP